MTPSFGPAPYYPTRESDGVPYLSLLVDVRALEQQQARRGFDEHMAAARVARERGDTKGWCSSMDFAGFYRGRLMSHRRKGWKRDAVLGTVTNKAWKDAA